MFTILLQCILQSTSRMPHLAICHYAKQRPPILYSINCNKIQTLYKITQEKQTTQNTAKQNQSGLVASYDIRPGNEVGLFYNAPKSTWANNIPVSLVVKGQEKFQTCLKHIHIHYMSKCSSAVQQRCLQQKEKHQLRS